MSSRHGRDVQLCHACQNCRACSKLMNMHANQMECELTLTRGGCSCGADCHGARRWHVARLVFRPMDTGLGWGCNMLQGTWGSHNLGDSNTCAHSCMCKSHTQPTACLLRTARNAMQASFWFQTPFNSGQRATCICGHASRQQTVARQPHCWSRAERIDAR